MKKCVFTSLLCMMSILAFSQDFQVPTKYEFQSKEDYQPYEPQVLKAIEWALNTPLDQESEKRQEVYIFLMKWLTGTPNVSIDINFDVVHISKTNQDLLFPFMLGWTRYALTNNYSKDKLQGNTAGIEAAVEFYKKNKKNLIKDKDIEKFDKLIQKGKLKEELQKRMK